MTKTHNTGIWKKGEDIVRKQKVV